jgi:hypothetical protein
MALERSERRLPQIDPSSLIGRADADVVGPRATSALIDAFRSGIVTADDILQRTGELGKTKKKAELMSLQEQMSPEAQQARGLARQAQTAQNQQVVDTAGLARQAKETELQAAIWKAQAAPGDYELKLNALTRAGISVPVSLEGGLNDAQRAQIDQEFSDLSDYTTQQAMADQYIKGTDAKDLNLKHTDAAGNVIEEVRPGGMILGPDRQPISPEKFKQAVQYRQTPYNLWKAQGKNKFGNLFGPAGQVSPTSPPVGQVDPAAAARARAQMVNAGMPSAQAVGIPDAQVVAPRSVPVAKPVVGATPELGSTTPGGGIVTTITEPKKDIKQIPSEGVKQLGLANQAFQISRRLDQAYSSLIESDPIFTGLIAGSITKAAAGKRWNDKIAAFEREATAILAPIAKGTYNETGVLSDKDVARYKDVIPDLRDNPSIGQQKIRSLLRETDQSYANILDHWKRAGYDTTGFEDKMTGASGGAAAPAATSEAAGPVVNIPGVGRVQRLSNGQYRRVQ